MGFRGQENAEGCHRMGSGILGSGNTTVPRRGRAVSLSKNYPVQLTILTRKQIFEA